MKFLELNKKNEKLGLLQAKNGPCGILAAINAILISQNLSSPNFGLDSVVTTEMLSATLSSIILKARVSEENHAQVAKWKGNYTAQ